MHVLYFIVLTMCKNLFIMSHSHTLISTIFDYKMVHLSCLFFLIICFFIYYCSIILFIIYILHFSQPVIIFSDSKLFKRYLYLYLYHSIILSCTSKNIFPVYHDVLMILSLFLLLFPYFFMHVCTH